MYQKHENRSRDNRLFSSIKWLLTAVSGLMTTALIVLLGPVAT